MTERCVVFGCNAASLVGILHQPDGTARDVGVLVVVGGPQYRIGSHRQFVLMARALAGAGYPVLRFDYRGMGDSDGETQTFESVRDDIGSAIDAFFAQSAGVRRIVVFGLCDAASAALMYGDKDGRVQGMILANPWVRTVEGEARAFVKHYYGQRLLQRSFWTKLVRGELAVVAAVKGLVRNWWMAGLKRQSANPAPVPSFIDRMRVGFERFRHPVLVVLSDQDLTAREFSDLCKSDAAWSRLMKATRVTRLQLADADHTFSCETSLDQFCSVVLHWLESAMSSGS